jgi:ABC-type sugar transport system substrate-binding protein
MVSSISFTSRRAILGGIAGGIATSLLPGCRSRNEQVRIGFVLKQPEEQWFQDEWRYAGVAARELGFDLIRIGATDGDRVMTAIDNLYARYAQGLVICAPDTRLGTAIQQRARVNELKLISVDDRLLGADGQPLLSVPHVGISAAAIGKLAGESAAAEAQRRGWSWKNTGLLRVAFDSLETARERTENARAALLAAGLPKDHVFDAPQRTTDTEGGLTAASPVLGRQRDITQWIVVGLNDEAVLGGVRASEGLGLAADAVIGVGIGGSNTAVAEMQKSTPTGFFGSVLLSARRHGYDTAVAMYQWITKDIAPPPLTLTSGEMMTRDNFKQLLARDQA